MQLSLGENGWTGGQYSLYRALLATYLLVHFLHLAPWAAEVFSNRGALPDGRASPLLHLFPNVFALYDSPACVTGAVILAAALCIPLALGWHDRPAAAAIYYIWACLFGRNPLIYNPSLAYVGLLLLVHVFTPPAPFGSIAARGRVDPNGSWRLPQSLFVVVWILMALGYSYSGYTKLVSPSWRDGTAIARVLDNPLARPTFLRHWLLLLPAGLLHIATWAALAFELLFAPMALIRPLRKWLWFGMLLMHIGLMVLIDFADLTLGMVMLHLFTFNPAWVRPRSAAGREIVFYDGHCGLCHRSVRFIFAEDAANALVAAPLEGVTFAESVTPADRANLPDSIVLQMADGQLLTRSAAILHILHRLGGGWRIVGFLLGFVPRILRDVVYDRIARIRKRVFKAPAEACPMMPAELRRRVLP